MSFIHWVLRHLACSLPPHHEPLIVPPGPSVSAWRMCLLHGPWTFNLLISKDLLPALSCPVSWPHLRPDLVILSNYSVSEITLSVILLSPQPPLLLACWFTPVMVVLWPYCNVSFIGPATFYQPIQSFLSSFSFLSSLDSITVAKPLSSLISCIFDAFAWENPNPDELSYSYFHAYIV